VEGDLSLAATEGIPLRFEKYGRNFAPERLGLQLRTDLDWKNAVPLGHTTAKSPGKLDIGSQSVSHSVSDATNHSDSLGGSGELGSVGNVGSRTVGGSAGADISYNWSSSSRLSQSYTTNHVALIEDMPDGTTAVYRVPLKHRIVLLDDAGNEHAVSLINEKTGQSEKLETTGYADLGINSDLLPLSDKNRAAALTSNVEVDTPVEVLRRAVYLGGDYRNLGAASRTVARDLGKPGSPAYDATTAMTQPAMSGWIAASLSSAMNHPARAMTLNASARSSPPMARRSRTPTPLIGRSLRA
jgi:hypothetical protein